MEEKRLDRIEEKLDELTKVVTDLARIEERMISLFKRMDRYDSTLAEVSDRLGVVESIADRRGVVFQAAEKVVWIVVGAGVAWLIGKAN